MTSSKRSVRVDQESRSRSRSIASVETSLILDLDSRPNSNAKSKSTLSDQMKIRPMSLDIILDIIYVVLMFNGIKVLQKKRH